MRYLAAAALTIAAWLLKLTFPSAFGPPFILFYPTVMLTALAAGLGPGLLATALSTALVGRSFLPADPSGWALRDAVGLAIFAATSAALSVLANSLQSMRLRITAYQAQAVRREAEERLRATTERLKQTQDEATLGAARLEAVFQSMHSGVLLFDQQRTVVLVNQSQARLLGFANADAFKRDLAWFTTAFELTTLEGRVLRTEEWPPARVLRGESLTDVELQCRRRDTGQEWVFSFSGQPVRGERGEQVLALVITRDVTARMQAERALRESEERLRLFVDHAPAAVAMFDRRMRYLAVSRRFISDYHLHDKELVGRSHYDVFPEVPERWRQIHRRCLAGAVEKCDEDPFPRADGQVDWVRWEIHPWHRADGEIGGLFLFSELVTESRQARERLAAEKERLAVTLRSIADAVIATDETGRVTLINPVAESLTNWPAREAVGQPLAEVFRIVDEAGRQPAESPVEHVLRDGRVVGLANHTVLISRDGTERPILDSGAPIRDATGKVTGVVLVFRDQTEERRAAKVRAEAEARVALSEARFRGFFEQAAVGLAEVETATGRFLRVNDKYAQFLGYSGEELAGRTWMSVTPPDSVAGDQAKVAEMVASGGAYSREKRYVRKDGGIVWGELSVAPLWQEGGTPTSQLAVVADVTERRRAALALQESERRLEAIFRLAVAGILVTRASDGAILDCNDAWLGQVGFTRAEVLGRTTVGLGIYSEPAQRDRLYQALASNGTAQPMEVHVRRKSGAEGNFILSVANAELAGERCLLGVWHDVTGQRTLEDQFRQAQKLESIGRLASGVAHDFNNLLTVILGCTEVLQAHPASRDPLVAEDLQEIRGAGERAKDLTRQLLAFARKQPIAPVPLDLAAVVRDSEKLLRRVLGEDVRLVVEGQADPWLALCDRGQVEQVLLNLAVNARDAMPLGGTLAIQTRNADAAHDPLVHGPDGPPGEFVQLSVQDSGCGMPPEVKAHLFEPFFTTKAPGKGTGLGLATVHGIVAQTGGHIRVESEPGKGTCFYLCFPRTQLAPVMEEPPAPVELRGSGNVLVIEDDPHVRAQARRALEQAGYRVLTAQDGDGALALALEEVGKLDLVVTDVVMPGAGVAPVIEALGRIQPRLRVLYISGHAGEYLETRGVPAGGEQFLAKPFTARTLQARVRALLDGAARR